MATETGVWTLQEVRDKQLAGEWDYTNAGGLYVTGGDPWESGMTGQNDRVTRSSPIQIPGQWDLQDSIFAGDNKLSILEQNVMAIKSDGTLWGWGANNKGKYAQNNETQYSSPVQVGSDTTWNVLSLSGTNSEGGHCIKTDGTLWAWGDNNYGQLGVNKCSNRIFITSSNTWYTTWKATMALMVVNLLAFKTDGTFWTCGS